MPGDTDTDVFGDPSHAVALAAIGKAYSTKPNKPGATDYDKYKRDTLNGLALWASLKLEWQQNLVKQAESEDAVAEAGAKKLNDALASKQDELTKISQRLRSWRGPNPDALVREQRNEQAINDELKASHARVMSEIAEIQQKARVAGNKREAKRRLSNKTKQRRVESIRRAEAICKAVEALR